MELRDCARFFSRLCVVGPLAERLAPGEYFQGIYCAPGARPSNQSDEDRMPHEFADLVAGGQIPESEVLSLLPDRVVFRMATGLTTFAAPRVPPGRLGC